MALREVLSVGGAECSLFAADGVHFAPCIQTSHANHVQANNHVCWQLPSFSSEYETVVILLSFRDEMPPLSVCVLTPWELDWSLGERWAAGQIDARAFVSCSNSFCLPEEPESEPSSRSM